MGCPVVTGPRGVTNRPHPHRPGDRRDVFQGWVGCADTKRLFACRPHSLGIACVTGYPGAAT